VKITRRRVGSVVALALLAVLVWCVNYFIVTEPVQTMLGDTKAQGYTVTSHFAYYVNPLTLVLDVRSADTAEPGVLFRSVFAAAHAMHVAYRPFQRVLLARSGKTVFVLDGVQFDTIGAVFARGQSRDFLTLRLPGMLRTPQGDPAYPAFVPGPRRAYIAAVENAKDAAKRWAAGQ
jgi:hypothetical protein